MTKILQSIEADETLLLSIIKDGHSFAFNELNSDSSKALKLDAKPELKQIIIGKLEQLYIV